MVVTVGQSSPDVQKLPFESSPPGPITYHTNFGADANVHGSKSEADGTVGVVGGIGDAAASVSAEAR